MKLNPRQYDLRDFDEDEEETPRMPKKPAKQKKPQKMRDEFTKRDNKKFNKPNKNTNKYDS